MAFRWTNLSGEGLIWQDLITGRREKKMDRPKGPAAPQASGRVGTPRRGKKAGRIARRRVYGCRPPRQASTCSSTFCMAARGSRWVASNGRV